MENIFIVTLQIEEYTHLYGAFTTKAQAEAVANKIKKENEAEWEDVILKISRNRKMEYWHMSDSAQRNRSTVVISEVEIDKEICKTIWP